MNPMMKTILLFCVSFVFLQSISAQEWVQWRGPNRDGVVNSFKSPKIYPNELKKKWSINVGEGIASPIVSGNRAYLISRQNEKETISSFDVNSGKTLWSNSYDTDYIVNEAAKVINKAPRSTPLLHNGKLYTMGISGVISAFDAKTGKLLWRKDVVGSGKIPYPQFGYCISPLIVDGLLILPTGNGKESALAAFNADTGEMKWKWVGDYQSVDDGIGYSSPILMKKEGTLHLVVSTDKALVGLAPSTGTLLWKFPFALEWAASLTPTIHGEHLIISDKNQGTVAIRVFKKGNDWTVEQVWQNQDPFMYMTSPVLRGNLMFGMSVKKKGQYFCLDANTGKDIWKTEGRDGEYSSLLLADEDLFIQTVDGELIVTKSSDKGFTPIKRYKVADSQTWAHPVLLRDQILIKDAMNLSLWSLK